MTGARDASWVVARAQASLRPRSCSAAPPLAPPAPRSRQPASPAAPVPRAPTPPGPDSCCAPPPPRFSRPRATRWPARPPPRRSAWATPFLQSPRSPCTTRCPLPPSFRSFTFLCAPFPFFFLSCPFTIRAAGQVTAEHVVPGMKQLIAELEGEIDDLEKALPARSDAVPPPPTPPPQTAPQLIPAPCVPVRTPPAAGPSTLRAGVRHGSSAASFAPCLGAPLSRPPNSISPKLTPSLPRLASPRLASPRAR